MKNADKELRELGFSKVSWIGSPDNPKAIWCYTKEEDGTSFHIEFYTTHEEVAMFTDNIDEDFSADIKLLKAITNRAEELWGSK